MGNGMVIPQQIMDQAPMLSLKRSPFVRIVRGDASRAQKPIVVRGAMTLGRDALARLLIGADVSRFKPILCEISSTQSIDTCSSAQRNAVGVHPHSQEASCERELILIGF